MKIMQLDTRKLENVVMADVQMFDFPDFVDAYVEYAEINGVELTDAQYYEVNEDHSFLQELKRPSTGLWKLRAYQSVLI